MSPVNSERPIRVLHCPHNVAGNPEGLTRAERKAGLESRLIVFASPEHGYQCDEILFNPGESTFISELKRWKFLWRALKYFDVIHFNSGSSIMPQQVISQSEEYERYSFFIKKFRKFYAGILEQRDIPLLKRAGKAIVVTYQGSEARQADFCRNHFDITFAHQQDLKHYSPQNDEHKRKLIETFTRYADRIFALNPDLLHVLPQNARFLPYAHIDLNEWQPMKEKRNTDRPLVVHAPTNRRIKGTEYIFHAVSKLKAQGVEFEFKLVEQMPFAEVKQIYEKADLLIDQLLVGWYGGLSVEFMALGKPVICYIREDDLKFVPEQMKRDLPVINANPGTIYNVLKEWLTVRKKELRQFGQRGRMYVESWHDPLKIAKKLKHDYESILNFRK